MPRSLAYAEQARADGRDVIGASSLGHDPASTQYEHWLHIPFVTDPEFIPMLKAAVKTHEITAVYTPNAVIWDVLNDCLAKDFPGLRLVNRSPMSEVTAPYAKAEAFAQSVAQDPLQLFDISQRDLPNGRELAAIYHHVETIPGMCDHEKTRALCSIFRSAPAGDIVEVGSWWGKSAFLLLRLARLNGTGPLLCVDPWAMEFLAQNDEGGLVDKVEVDPDAAFEIFATNLLPYVQSDANYLRMPSVEAAKKYVASSEIVSSEFGAVRYQGDVAVLHIDGNHSEPAVRADIAAWCPLVRSGGWIVLDDYVWPYGDGPKRAGDDFLRENASSIKLSFVMGSALFIKLVDD